MFLIGLRFGFNRLTFQFICMKYQERKLISQNAPSEKKHQNNDGSFIIEIIVLFFTPLLICKLFGN